LIDPSARRRFLLAGQLIAAWSIFIGIFVILGVFQLRKESVHEWTLGLTGLTLLGFGVVIASSRALSSTPSSG
jgi:hypothetical protein